MIDSVRSIIAGLYDQDHVGVEVISGVLTAEELELLNDTFNKNAELFLPLDFGDVTRWDLTEGDFCNFPELGIGREKVRNIIDVITRVTECNSVYKEKFCVLFYPEGSSGVKPHRDTEHSVNCVIILVVKGQNSFCVARDKECKEVVEFPVKPGDVIVMRGPRSINDKLSRPIHYVNKVIKPRYVMIYRHVNLDGLKKPS